MSGYHFVRVPPPTDLLTRGYPIAPFSPIPPHQRSGVVPVTPARAAIRAAGPTITRLAEAQGYWVTVDQPPLPDPPCLLDIDFVLLTCVDLWLHRLPEQAEEDGHLLIDVKESAIPFAVTHPAKQRLMSNAGIPFRTSEAYPSNWVKQFLDRIRKLHSAGFLALAQAPGMDGLTAYEIEPMQIGLIRAVWAARIIGYGLPHLGPSTT